MHTDLAVSFVMPSPKKIVGNGNRFVHEEPFIDKRKPSSTMVERGVLNNGEHMLIPVMARMIHSAIWNSKRFILKDGQPLHMVKLVGAVRYFRENIKHILIDVEDGTGLVRVILWRKTMECMAQHQMIRRNCAELPKNIIHFLVC
jgi:hypothetical protein